MLTILCAVLTFSMSASSASPAAAGPLDWEALALSGGDHVRFDESAVPANVRQHLGRAISLRGYMHPGTPELKNNPRFVLCAETNAQGKRGVRLHEYVAVEMQGEAHADYVIAPILVTGVLSLDVIRDADGKAICLYKFKATSATKTAPRPGYRCVGDLQGC